LRFLFSVLQARVFVRESSTSGSRSMARLFLGHVGVFFSFFAVSITPSDNEAMNQAKLVLERR
jgi:hypothetical protein